MRAEQKISHDASDDRNRIYRLRLLPVMDALAGDALDRIAVARLADLLRTLNYTRLRDYT